MFRQQKSHKNQPSEETNASDSSDSVKKHFAESTSSSEPTESTLITDEELDKSKVFATIVQVTEGDSDKEKEPSELPTTKSISSNNESQKDSETAVCSVPDKTKGAIAKDPQRATAVMAHIIESSSTSDEEHIIGTRKTIRSPIKSPLRFHSNLQQSSRVESTISSVDSAIDPSNVSIAKSPNKSIHTLALKSKSSQKSPMKFPKTSAYKELQRPKIISPEVPLSTSTLISSIVSDSKSPEAAFEKSRPTSPIKSGSKSPEATISNSALTSSLNSGSKSPEAVIEKSLQTSPIKSGSKSPEAALGNSPPTSSVKSGSKSPEGIIGNSPTISSVESSSKSPEAAHGNSPVTTHVKSPKYPSKLLIISPPKNSIDSASKSRKKFSIKSPFKSYTKSSSKFPQNSRGKSRSQRKSPRKSPLDSTLKSIKSFLRKSPEEPKRKLLGQSPKKSRKTRPPTPYPRTPIQSPTEYGPKFYDMKIFTANLDLPWKADSSSENHFTSAVVMRQSKEPKRFRSVGVQTKRKLYSWDLSSTFEDISHYLAFYTKQLENTRNKFRKAPSEAMKCRSSSRLEITYRTIRKFILYSVASNIPPTEFGVVGNELELIKIGKICKRKELGEIMNFLKKLSVILKYTYRFDEEVDEDADIY